MNERVFIQDNDVDWEITGPGVKRKIMAWDERVMLVKVAFDKDSIGYLHKHYHTQITHIAAGSFKVTIGKEKKILKTGDAFYIPPNEEHGVVCLEEGLLIDVFSPYREDFVQKS